MCEFDHTEKKLIIHKKAKNGKKKLNVAKIKNYMRRNHITQLRLSEILYCSRSKIANKISDRDQFTPAECIALAQLLDIPRKEFIDIFINDNAINDMNRESE